MSGEIDIVLPVAALDGPRLQVLGASLRKFWHVPGTLHVIAPVDGEIDVVAEAARAHLDGPLRVEISVGSDVLERPPSRFDGQRGWWRQQIAKLRMAETVGTDFYLTLDADCFVVRPVEFGDLVHRGRSVVAVEAIDRFRPAWYHTSAGILGLNERELPPLFLTPMAVTLARTVVRSLITRLAAKWPNWIGGLLVCSSAETSWTEYTLYHLHARNAGLWDAFHAERTLPLVGNSIWFRSDIESWNPRACFEQPTDAAPFFYSVVQSHTTLPASWVWERVEPFLR